MLLLAALAATLGGAISLAGATVSSGVQGVVLRGPVTPVCRAELPCSAPVAGALVVVRRPTATVAAARGRTDTKGRFSFALAPASYVVSVTMGRATALRTHQRRVQVQSGRFTAVKFVFDTGIR